MKFRKILFCLVSAGAAVTVSSCLMSQKDIFDSTAAARVEKYLDGAMQTLVSAESGWSLDLFTFVGGYSYAMKFSESGEVQVASELKPSTVEQSYFKLVNDNGPVLSFDTYNSLFHYFATPSSSNYEGLGGDFEFIIMSYSDTRIELKGKRSGFYATLTPLPASTSITGYTEKMANIAKDFLLLEFDCDINGDTTYTGKIDLASRILSFARYDEDGVVIGEERQRQYIYTETGLRLYDTLTVEGSVFSEFAVDRQTNQISATDVPGVTLSSRGIPDYYYLFDEYPGDYTFVAGGKSYDVRLTVYDEFQRVLNLEGLDADDFNYEIYLDYDPSSGQIVINPQLIHQGDEVCQEDKEKEVYVAMLGFDQKGSGSPYYYVKGVWNKSKTNPVINFETGTEIANVRGYLLWNYDGSEGWDTQYTGKTFYPTSLNPLTSLTRKK